MLPANLRRAVLIQRIHFAPNRCYSARPRRISSMSDNINPGDKVAWNWGSSHAEGVVSEKHTDHVSKEIKGKTINRNGTEDNPAFFVEREDPKKNPVLKKASELHKLESDETTDSHEHVKTRRQQALQRDGDDEEEDSE